MPIFHPKKIKHLARYFGVLGVLILVGYFYSSFSNYFLIILGPAFFLAYWLRTFGPVTMITSFIPNEPLYNNLLIIFTTIVYFGLLGFQLKNILNERGKIRLVILLVFFGFLFHIHRLAFKELSLYLGETGKPTARSSSTDFSSARNRPLGDQKS